MQSEGARVCQETHFHSRQVHVARTLRHLVYTRIIRVAEPVGRLFISARIVAGVCVSPLSNGGCSLVYTWSPRIRTIKGGKFWNVEQRKNTWSNRRARDERGLHGYPGTVILLLCSLFSFNPDRSQRGMWTIHFLSYAKVWNEYLQENWNRIIWNNTFVLMCYLINQRFNWRLKRLIKVKVLILISWFLMILFN